jgi:signal transduction histidine kinase
MNRRLPYPRAWLHLPRHTIRLRLTLLYGALFLASGAALLTVTYLLVERQYTQNGASFFISSGRIQGGGAIVSVNGAKGLPDGPNTPIPGLPTPNQVKGQARAQSSAALHGLLINSGIALAIMAVISIWLGWLVAGRALRPLRTITNAAREISASSLHRRLALAGPDDEIKQLAGTFDELLERLEASFDAQRQFVANASHELRTPLTLERTLVEVALADPNASVDSLRKMGKQVLAAGAQQERLIEALLILSRSQRGLDRHEPIDLTNTIARTLHTLEANGLTVTAELEAVSTSGDPRLIERLVANLLTNAARHNIPNGRVEIRTKTRAGRALLTVDNTGPLIPANELKRLFLPFQRLDSERTTGTGGLGLGLSIVQAIATAHHAKLNAQARPNGGLHVEVSFPTQPQLTTARFPSTRHVPIGTDRFPE